MKGRILLLIFIKLCISSLNAQDLPYKLSIEPALPKELKGVKTSFKDSTSLKNELKRIDYSLKAAGYINYQIMSDTQEGTHRNIKYNYNNVWTWEQLRIDEQLQTYLPKNNFNNITTKGKIIKEDVLLESIENLLTYAEDNGYPFAEIYFDSLQTYNRKVSATLRLRLNPYIQFDTIAINNKKIIQPVFLSAYLGIREGQSYSEKKIQAVQNRIDELGFIRLKYPPKIYFNNNKAMLVLSPEKRNANKFDGLIGVQPNANTQKTAIVGQAQLYLINTLGRAERLQIEFRSQANETRDLRAMLSYPFLFSTPFGLSANIDIRRQDTSFSSLGRSIAIQYLIRGNNQVSLLYKVNESNLLSVKKYIGSNTLPENLDVKKRSYGLNNLIEELDYRINPSKGYSISTTLLFGTREVKRNANFADSLYDAINLNSSQVQAAVALRKFFKLSNKNVLLLSYKTEWVETEQLFNNELVRFGGINDLRGFDEESIFASYYWVSTIEYRFLLDRNSFFRLFYDQGYYFNKILKAEDYPSGLGLGLQLQTLAGALQVNYALGEQLNSGYNFQSGKIHFGIINYF